MLLVLAITLSAAVLPQQSDTTVTVRPGSRLELDNFEGTVTITAWNRPAVRVETTSEDERPEVEVTGSMVRVSAQSRHGPGSADFRISVPADMDLEINGHSGDIRVSGVKGEIRAETVEGNITVQGGSGFVLLHSVEGDLVLEGAQGDVELNTVDGSISVTRVTGGVRAETVDGDVSLVQVDAATVTVNTVDGNIVFEGGIQPRGRYRLTSHDGDVTVTAASVDAVVSVSTFDGDFESDWPVQLTSTRRNQRMEFTLGSGSARLHLESFDGLIRLQKKR